MKLHRGMFPQVFLFPARESDNVVLVATLSPREVTLDQLLRRAETLIRSRRVTLENFRTRVAAFRSSSPPNAQRSPILTDDFAPVDGLVSRQTLDELGNRKRF